MSPVAGCPENVEFRSDQLEKAKEAAYIFLKNKLRTEWEVTKDLLQKGFDENTVSKVVAGLRQYRLLDDQLYAVGYIARRRHSSRAALEYELRSLGVKDPIISRALSGVDVEKEFDKALRLSERRYGGKEYNAAKITAFLRRKGFTQDIAEMVCERLRSGRLAES